MKKIYAAVSPDVSRREIENRNRSRLICFDSYCETCVLWCVVHDRHTIAERNDYESLALLPAIQR